MVNLLKKEKKILQKYYFSNDNKFYQPIKSFFFNKRLYL